MAVNKVVYAGRTLVDLTGDSVTPDTLAEGVTAHAASGEGVTGTMTAVQYGKSQSLSATQKTQARTNIGAASAEEVSQLSAEIVTKPTTAKVGQVIAVKAVDGNGKPTEWEAVDMAAGENAEFNPLRGKKVSFLGDSICAGSNDTYMGGYGKIIAERNGMVYENVARAGATVTAETYSRSTGNAKPWLCRMVENMSSDADYAIVEGGINDGWDETVKANIGSITKGYDAALDDTTYYGAFESMLKQLVTKFQGKKIGYIAVPKIHSLFDSNQNSPNFYHIALECCAKWGVTVCDLNTITPPVEYLSDLGTEYTADGTHPTQEGYLKYYCDPIEAWMKTLTTGSSISVGTAVLPNLDEKYVRKSDVQTKKAKLTLEDGTMVLIDVVVASAGADINKYINLVPTSIDTDGNVFNGTGYQEGYRLSSGGVTKEQAGVVVTGYIPVKSGDVVRINGCEWATALNSHNYICAYDSNFAFIGANATVNSGTFSLTKYTNNVYAEYTLEDNYNITMTLAALSNIAYIRVCSKGNTSGNNATFDPTDMIVTVNQEIS